MIDFLQTNFIHRYISTKKSYIFSSKVRLGEHNLTNSGPDCSDIVCNLGVQDMDVEKIIVHESYNKPFSFQNDIALVKLKRKVSENGM